MGVVVKRYIDFFILPIPTPLVFVLFCSSNAYKWHTWYVLQMKLWGEVVCHFMFKDEQIVVITFVVND